MKETRAADMIANQIAADALRAVVLLHALGELSEAQAARLAGADRPRYRSLVEIYAAEAREYVAYLRDHADAD